MSQNDLETLIDRAYGDPKLAESAESRDAVDTVVARLDSGTLRVCTREASGWVTHAWIKKAILLYFRQSKMNAMRAGDLSFFDKVPLKQWDGSEGVRVVPSALVRRGAFVEPGAILMPSYVNIGARVGSGTMVDTWATVGSCAQVGAQVHLSGGVGIGGVLEPIQASPVIIEDHVFLGSRCIVVEGVVVEEGAVLGAGVVLTASTKILDVTGPQVVEHRGRVPERSVVIPGTVPKSFPAGTYGVPCALIIGRRSAKTDKKTSLTDALRDFSVSA
ncbi:MAG: 2,3,4,5-tetrahydropyridine-2,6-dicarboxylate N-succinyltransferase [Bdellovibrionales bacterium]|nr:2,3,4,5-tetrahydropyridine-2,6-dicarboxylate N-succinyltransferase [Bdellovibrionales bacterium]